MGLTEILGGGNAAPGGAAAGSGNPGSGNLAGQVGAKTGTAENRTGLPGPEQVGNERLAGGGQPLVAASKPLVAAEVVTQSLGPNRRDRNVRFVRARSGDSLDLLVRRWCGARDPFLAEAKSLNEDLVTLQVGQEVAVPYIEDEVLMATLEAPPANPGAINPAAINPAATNQPAGTASAAELGSLLGTRVPGSLPTNASTVRPETPTTAGSGVVASRGSAMDAAVVRGTTHTVKSGESLWRIAERTYGRQLAGRMIPAIKDANPGLTEKLSVGQKIMLPTAP
jgi:nucleoid-associated protein YgaU